MTTQFTDEQAAQLSAYLDTHHIPSGLGTKEEACSVAAINLAISGKLTDEIPDCMSEVIGRWIIRIQDRMPDELRNSSEWKRLLPLAAGTGREMESERRAIIIDWLFSSVLPLLQPYADEKGFGGQWRTMCQEQTFQASQSARRAAVAADAYAFDSAVAAVATAILTDATGVDRVVAYAFDATIACPVSRPVVSKDEFWEAVDPCGLLAKLTEVTQ